MIAWRSIEFRLTAWYSFMLFLGLALFSLALWLVVTYALRSGVDELLADRLERLVRIVTADADTPDEVEEALIEYTLATPESHLAQIRDGDNRRVLPPAESQPIIPWVENEGKRLLRTVESGGTPYRVLVEDLSVMGQRYRISLASSLQNLVEVRNLLAVSFLIATPLALLLCSGGGFYIARRALEPVDQITETASDITVTNLSRRIPVPETGDALERLSRTLNEMLERLERSVMRIEQFSADASHELRSPISVIRTTSELALRHGRSEADYRADLQDIHAQAVRLTELIDVLLTLSRKGAQSQSVPLSDLDLATLAADVCRQYQKQADSKGLILELETPEQPVLVIGNDVSLRRVIASLLDNALAHTSDGAITVSVRPGDEPELTVEDTGEGIPEEALGRIFDRFYRGDRARTRASGRVGLGLSIAQRIAELHGAEITARSRVGEGSRFTVRFRRHANTPEAASTPPVPS